MLVKMPRMTQATMTTTVESRSSVQVGHEAFFSSSINSPEKMRALRNGFFIKEGKVAGAEGIEPPTNGFGDRYSTN